MAAVPDGSALAERSTLTLADLADHPVAMSPNGTTTLEAVAAASGSTDRRGAHDQHRRVAARDRDRARRSA